MGSLCWWYDRETFLPPAKTVTHQRNNLLSDIIARKTDNNFKRISNDIAGFGLLGNFEGVNQLQDNLFIREIVTGQHNTAYCRAQHFNLTTEMFSCIKKMFRQSFIVQGALLNKSDFG